MVNVFDKPDDFIPDEPATFIRPPSPVSPPKTMLEQLWEEEPFPFIPDKEPEEEENFVKVVSHQEGLRLMSEDLDEYIKRFRRGYNFLDITRPFLLVGDDGDTYSFQTNRDLLHFHLAAAYSCIRLKYGDEAIPPFHKFYKKLSKIILHSSASGKELRRIVGEVRDLIEANEIGNIHQLMEKYCVLNLPFDRVQITPSD